MADFAFEQDEIGQDSLIFQVRYNITRVYVQGLTKSIGCYDKMLCRRSARNKFKNLKYLNRSATYFKNTMGHEIRAFLVDVLTT